MESKPSQPDSGTLSAPPLPPLCIGCTYFTQPVDQRGDPPPSFLQRCAHPTLRSLVDGRSIRCTQARAASGACGPSGLLFKAIAQPAPETTGAAS